MAGSKLVWDNKTCKTKRHRTFILSCEGKTSKLCRIVVGAKWQTWIELFSEYLMSPKIGASQMIMHVITSKRVKVSNNISTSAIHVEGQKLPLHIWILKSFETIYTSFEGLDAIQGDLGFKFKA